MAVAVTLEIITGLTTDKKSNAPYTATSLETLWLSVSTIDHSIARQPIVIGIPEVNKSLPANVDAVFQGQPVAFGLDFGLLTETIRLSGISKDGNTGVANPSHSQLADVVRKAWIYVQPTGNLGIDGGLRLTIDEGIGHNTHTYIGIPLEFSANREGGNTYWSYTLTLQVAMWPIGDTVSPPPPPPGS